tara:strand:- start:1481 stop:1891 length:411 start_codon:yes stop_codon:yes gene_type:complete
MNWIKTTYSKLYKTSILKKKQKDFGFLVLVVSTLMFAYNLYKNGLVLDTEVYTLILLFSLVLIITFVYRKLFVPFLFLWLLIGEILGAITSTVIIAIIYFLLFSPIVLILRLFRKEGVYKPEWKTVSRVIDYTKLS